LTTPSVPPHSPRTALRDTTRTGGQVFWIPRSPPPRPGAQRSASPLTVPPKRRRAAALHRGTGLLRPAPRTAGTDILAMATRNQRAERSPPEWGGDGGATTGGQVFWILRGQTPPPSGRPTLGLAPNGSSKAAEGRRTPQADRSFESRPVHGGDRHLGYGYEKPTGRKKSSGVGG
jgi:hypothetical protein